MVQIYNSLTQRKEVLTPIEPGKVRLYVCGMTVYDYCHLGHARVLVVFDTVVRYLRARGLAVTYVRNITDIDDKILRRAEENGEPYSELTARFIHAMNEDSQALGVSAPDHEPRATQSIADIIALIVQLQRNGYAYQAANGDVYYIVSRFAAYGKLSGERLQDLRAGARVDVDDAKQDPLDFGLWKAAKTGEPAWDSPWGAGRPGWHIECSAMAMRCLGEHFDIHGGGMDLKFPHHENEIAQSEAATGHRFVNIWMHNGFVRVNEEKMSKSLGNFFTVRDVLKRYRPEEVRYFILASHYRSPLHYSDENLLQARAALARLYTALRGMNIDSETVPLTSFVSEFETAMDDDFNTPVALAVLFGLANECNRTRSQDMPRARQLAATLCHLGKCLGLLQDDAERYFQDSAGTQAEIESAEIEAAIAARNAARRAKNWTEADRIRETLSAAGITLEDRGEQTLWRRA